MARVSGRRIHGLRGEEGVAQHKCLGQRPISEESPMSGTRRDRRARLGHRLHLHYRHVSVTSRFTTRLPSAQVISAIPQGTRRATGARHTICWRRVVVIIRERGVEPSRERKEDNEKPSSLLWLCVRQVATRSEPSQSCERNSQSLTVDQRPSDSP